MNNYKVYMHKFPNDKVYIGMTCQEPNKRWKNGKAYKENKHFNNAISKYGWENIRHEILYSNLTKEEAEQKEIELIKQYKSNERKYGYNIEYGGCHNGKTSEETKRKLSIANKGKHNSPNTEFKKGRISIITDEMKEKISKANRGKHASINTEFKKGHLPLNNKKIMCVETNEKYDSIQEAYKITNIHHISEACRGIRKTAGKLHWKYIED